MKKLSILLLITIISCQKNNEHYSMFGLLNEELNQKNEVLKIQISKNLSNPKFTQKESVKLYDSITKEYLNYLNNICSNLISNIDDPGDYEGELSNKKYVNKMFFIGDKYSEKGMEFIDKMDSYRTEALKLINDEHLKNRIIGVLSSDDFLIRNGRVNYLDYMYKDFPLIGVLAHMNLRVNSILEIENEFLKNTLINTMN
ncbi:hypothetical protein N1F78_13305 [Seonamhaeicola sp. MEBiC1930]|uniref:hypothetical protein n=1 Tax=Seonamhaeicola sp. MEBiC01930 TaxID=2976768 RepID=UPI003255C6BD